MAGPCSLNLKELGKRRSWPILRYYSGGVGGTEWNHENPKVSRCPGRVRAVFLSSGVKILWGTLIPFQYLACILASSHVFPYLFRIPCPILSAWRYRTFSVLSYLLYDKWAPPIWRRDTYHLTVDGSTDQKLDWDCSSEMKWYQNNYTTRYDTSGRCLSLRGVAKWQLDLRVPSQSAVGP
jgi:hypothetical protein